MAGFGLPEMRYGFYAGQLHVSTLIKMLPYINCFTGRARLLRIGCIDGCQGIRGDSMMGVGSCKAMASAACWMYLLLQIMKTGGGRVSDVIAEMVQIVT